MEAFAPAAALAPATLPAAFVSTGNLRTLRIASAGYASAPGDTPASTAWTPRLLGDIEIGQTAVDALGSVDTYLSHRTVAARVTTAR